MPAQTVPFKSGVVSVLDGVGIAQLGEQPIRDAPSRLGQIQHLYRIAIQAVRQQQNLKGRALRVSVEPGLADVYVAVRLDVDAEMMYRAHSAQPWLGPWAPQPPVYPGAEPHSPGIGGCAAGVPHPPGAWVTCGAGLPYPPAV